MSKAYAGIGSRETPLKVQERMRSIADKLACFGYILRTGGASGADVAFIKGADRNMEIFVPSDGFNGFFKHQHEGVIDEIPDEAFIIAEKFHPTYNSLNLFVKRLMARNAMQVLGRDLDDPVEFIVCYTKDGKASGGTGQALRMAKHYGITTYNLKNNTETNGLQKRLAALDVNGVFSYD